MEGKLLLGVVTLLILAVAPAHAFYIDFSDLEAALDRQAAAHGERANLEINGVSITISSSSILGTGRSGLGVACVGTGRDCRGDHANRIDGRLGESLTIEFHNGPVRVEAIGLSDLNGRERAILTAGNETRTLERQHSGRNDAHSLEGLVTNRLTLSSWRRSDYSVTGIEISLIRPSVQPVRPFGVSNPVPEPTAALLFAAGLGIASVRVRRQ